jgi:adenylate kinase family enzyme
MLVGSSFIVWGATPILDNLLDRLSDEIKGLAGEHPIRVFKSGDQIKKYKFYTDITAEGVKNGLDIYDCIVGEVFNEFNVKKNDILISRGFPRNIFQAESFEYDHSHKNRNKVYVINVVSSFEYLESNFKGKISREAFDRRSKGLQSVVKYLVLDKSSLFEINGDQSEDLILDEIKAKLDLVIN